jgi:hypothetical protein
MEQIYFIQFNKSLTRREQHAVSGFALHFAGFTGRFTPFGMKGFSEADFTARFHLPKL